MTFGEKLKIARTEAGLKQAELAKQLNTTGNTISNWENNVSKPDVDTIESIIGKVGYFIYMWNITCQCFLLLTTISSRG